jgi:hypothetical protein
MPLHLVGINGNRVWHTTRRAGGSWVAWDDVFASAGSLSLSPGSDIACGFVRGALHVCVYTTQPDRLFHTIRFARGNWQPWGDAAAAGFSQLGTLQYVDCVGISDRLHVCVVGARPPSPQLKSLPGVFRAVRISNPNPALDSWIASSGITDAYLAIRNFACANVAGDQLHILARCVDRQGYEVLMRNIRFAYGSQQPLGDHDIFPFSPTLTLCVVHKSSPLPVLGRNSMLLLHQMELSCSTRLG